MAYITPNSTVRFHQNIVLDNTYDHTYYFSDRNAQETFFSYRDEINPQNSRVKITLNDYSYQRHTRDSIRVALPIENIVNCSYMSFKNTSFENKWFYAFITDMEYVNNNTTIVYYEIDVIQTYVFDNDFEFKQCYIERQHTISDEIGENTQPEPIGPCEYEFSNAIGYPGDSLIPDYSNIIISGKDTRYQNMAIVVASTFKGSNDGGIYTNYTERNINSFMFWNRGITGNDIWAQPASSSDGGAMMNIEGYQKLKITMPSITSGDSVIIAFLKSQDNFAFGGPVDYCFGTSSQYVIPSTTSEYNIPSDCKFVWLQYGDNGTKYEPTYLGFGKESEWSFSNDAYGGLYGGCYSGINLTVFDTNTYGSMISAANACTKFLEDAAIVPNLIDGVISIFMIPFQFTKLTQTAYPESFATLLSKYYNWTIDGHTPKNNKIFTAPYTMLHVISSDGKSADFPFEFFNTNYAGFINTGIAMPVSEIELIPENYKGLQFNRNEKFTIDNYPQCSFATDSYKAWLALNSSRMNFENIMSGVNAALGVAGAVNSFTHVSNPKHPNREEASRIGSGMQGASSVLSAVGTIGSNLIEKKLASTMPAHAHGQNTNILSVADSEFGYHYYYCKPRTEYARIIDDFFTRFGYAINQNAVPELCARTRFTYIKTVDCTIEANIPNEYSQKIVSIMNNGITFWNDKTSVGNYEIANDIIPG